MAYKTFSQLYTDGQTQADDSSSTALTIIKSGINEAYADIAASRDWDGLLDYATVSTVAGTEEYTPVTSSSSVERIRRIKSIVNQTSNQFLQNVDKELFRQNIPYVNTTTDRGTPTMWYFSENDSNRDMKIKLYPVPDQAYTLNVEYYKEPLELTNDADVPLIPDQYQYGLVYLGLAKYFEYQQDTLATYYRQLYEEYKRKILLNEWDNVDKMPAMTTQNVNQSYVKGKIGRIYNA